MDLAALGGRRYPGIAKECGDHIWNLNFGNPAIYCYLIVRSPFRLRGALGCFR
jgi:hypothetical protein